MSSSHPSTSPIGPSNCHSLADTHLKELLNKHNLINLCPQKNHDLMTETENPFPSKSEPGNPVAPVGEPLSTNPKADDPFFWSVAEALGPKSKTGDPVARGTRYYLVLTCGDKADLRPESIQVMDVSEVIPKGCMVKARAFCSGVAFNFSFWAANPVNYHELMKVKLCVVGGSDEKLTVIDLDRVGNSKLPDPNIIDGLVNSPAMKAMLSSVKDINLAEFMGHVSEYVGTQFGEEKKAEYLKMVQDYSSSTSSGLGGALGSLDSAEIWQMLTLQDRVMEAVMKSFQPALFVKMPITIDIPPASVTHPTPRDLGWKAGCSVAQGLKRRPCIPDLNQALVDLLDEEEAPESSVGVEEKNDGKKRKAEEAGVDVEAQDYEEA